MQVLLNGNVAFLPGPAVSVWFSQPAYTAYGGGGSSGADYKGTVAAMRELTTELDVAPWGEDNRFPQNINNQLDYCGVAKRALRFKAQALWGQGIVWGKVVDMDDKGVETFQVAKPDEYKEVRDFFRRNGDMVRFFAEFLNDWVTYENCFPEAILSKDGKQIMRWIHQESCDVRFKQANEKGELNTVFLSKLWGAQKDQFVRFKKEGGVKGLTGTDTPPRVVDNKFVKPLRAIDMYYPLDDARAAADSGYRNLILPVNYPSSNKTYYQLAAWDGARLSGWLEIAAKFPAMLKALYDNAFNIKYHVEIPESYFQKRYGDEKWEAMSNDERQSAKSQLLSSMNNFLSGVENAGKALVTYFDVDKHTKQELGHVKIAAIDNTSNVDKDLMTSNAADRQLIMSIGVDPALFGAGMIGGPSGSSGSGSDKREAWLIYTATLHLERQLILDPLNLTRDFNGWDPELKFRFRDTILTTLDKGKGTEKVLS